MRTLVWSLTLASAAVFCSCGTPSIHPLASDDTKATDPALVGTWAKPDADRDEAVYTIARAGENYALSVEDRDPKKPEKWDFEVRLVQLGKDRFVDVQPPEADRDKIDEKWSSLFIPAHLFARYEIEGDTLKVWILDKEWLRKSLASGAIKLPHTGIDHDWVLITASTPELQAFFREHARDADAFDLTELKRVKP